MPRIYVPLDPGTFEKLRALEWRERRRPVEQAAYIIERALGEHASSASSATTAAVEVRDAS